MCTNLIYVISQAISRKPTVILSFFCLCYSQEEGQLALIEQKELYTSNPDPHQDLLNPHKDRSFLSRLADNANLCGDANPREPIVRKLKESNLSESVINGYLDRREQGLFQLPEGIKTVLHPNQVPAFRDGSLLKRIEKEANVVSAPPASDSPPQSGVVSPTLTYISTLSSASDMATPTQTSSVEHNKATVTKVQHPYDGSSLAQAPPLKRQNLSTSSLTSTSSSVPTAHVRPIPRPSTGRREDQNFDIQKHKLESMFHQSTDTCVSYYPSVSLPLGHINSDSTVLDSGSTLGQSQHGVNPSNKFNVVPASSAIASLFGMPSSQQVPAFSGGNKGDMNFPHKNSSEGVALDFTYQNINSITPTLDLGYESRGSNGDCMLEDLLSEVNSEIVGGVDSSSDHTHMGGVSLYQNNSNAASGELEYGIGNNGANSELMEILSQFS